MRWHRYQVHTYDYVIDGVFSECMKNPSIETMGFLVGMYCMWRDNYYTLIDDYIPLEGSSDQYRVTPDVESIAAAFKILTKRYNDRKHFIAGWYHSHPGHGIFLSQIDIASQMTFFNQPYHVALVVDSKSQRYAFFKLSIDGKPVKVSYAVWRKSYESKA